MPAAAVIPAPIAYIKVAAVKKLVVGSRGGMHGPPLVVCTGHFTLPVGDVALALIGWDTEPTLLL